MGPDTIWVLIPLLAIGGGIVKGILNSQERRLELRLQAQQGQNTAVTEQIAALRQELAALRDTSTQFDVSMEQNVQRLEDRLGRLETKSTVQSITPSEEIPQRVGLR
jgi:predicted  nucleic acid-binding Zn-ribbon protein